ncbi:hypothetical protein NDU88_001953 [Pleurodeles waltl]|uniref:Uncharacterized protein n=1 Tax=Pleurodeles waltl TaxID=8319 RepID=A0AAV7T234_PLEWA|nr:hypothetical protein NDU88_001953 [Pleurodeles waltl]
MGVVGRGDDVEVVRSDDVGKRCHVDVEEGRAEGRSLGYAQMILVASDRKGGRRTLWVLPVGKEVIQSRALSRIPASWRHVRRVWRQTVSKAAERSRRMRAAVSPLSSKVLMSSVAAMRAVSVAAKTGLGWVQSVVFLKEVGQLPVDDRLDDLCREREQGDGPVVFWVLWVRLGLLE